MGQRNKSKIKNTKKKKNKIQPIPLKIVEKERVKATLKLVERARVKATIYSMIPIHILFLIHDLDINFSQTNKKQ